MELELARFIVTPVTAHRQDGRIINEDQGSSMAIFTVEQFADFMEICLTEIAERNLEMAAEAD